MPPTRFQQDNTKIVGLLFNDCVKPKVISNSVCEKQVKRKKKKKKGKHYLDCDEGIPSPTQSLDDSYTHAKSQAIASTSGMFSQEEIDNAVKYLEGNKTNFDSSTLIDTIYMQLQEIFSCETEQLDSVGESNNSIDCKLKMDAADELDEESDFEGDSSDDDYAERLNEALHEVKEKYLDMINDITIKCRICRDAQANILLLPCGHLVCCDSCLMDVRRCPITRCNKIVRGTKEVFYV